MARTETRTPYRKAAARSGAAARPGEGGQKEGGGDTERERERDGDTAFPPVTSLGPESLDESSLEIFIGAVRDPGTITKISLFGVFSHQEKSS